MNYLDGAAILKITTLFVLAVHGDDFDKTLGNVKPATSPAVQAAAVEALIKRLIPDRASEFSVDVDPDLGPIGRDTFRVVATKGKVTVTGSSGVAAAWGFHHYIKHYCGCHISWSVAQLSLPAVLPDATLKITSQDRFRYYQNVCTESYSMVWWDWQRWQKEIDWMAMNGINLALLFVGQEAIWKRVYLKLNFTEADLKGFFSGPAFLAWNRMANIDGWAGPLTDNWHKKRLSLLHKMFSRLQGLGITGVLPAFSGHVPSSFKRVFPHSNVSRLSDWGRFKEPYCCTHFLDPLDDLFQVLGHAYVSEMVSELGGTNHVYNADPFNEMTPPSWSNLYLKHAARNIYNAIHSADSEAVWMVQDWMFCREDDWTYDRVRAFVTAVPLGRMLLLDLSAEVVPQYIRTESYFGQPFIWCMLHNYGGTLGLYGLLPSVAYGPFRGRNMTGSSMVGTGLTMEGINTNYVVYDLMNEMGWRSSPPNLTEWLVSYASRRYVRRSGIRLPGAIKRAWSGLQKSVYNGPSDLRFHGKYILTRLPSMHLKPFIFYKVSVLLSAWDMFVNVSHHPDLSSSPGFLHDLVDVTREALIAYGGPLYNYLVLAYMRRNVSQARIAGSELLGLLDDLETLLASNQAYLLGPWVNSAKSWATNEQELAQYEFNARNQISIWGPDGEVRDYATKQWSGVVSGLYKPRWELFVTEVERCITTHVDFDQTAFTKKVLKSIETPFTRSRQTLPLFPTGDTVEIVNRLHAKYREKVGKAIFVKSEASHDKWFGCCD